MSQSDRRAAPPHPQAIFSANAFDKNFKKVICSKIVQKSYNKAFGVDRISQSPGVRVVIYGPGVYQALMEGVVL